MKSMTGFGQSKLQDSELQIEVSIRSVNGRFFEPRIHLPREYAFFESEIKKNLGKTFLRGTVDVYISRKKNQSESEKFKVNKAVAKALAKSYASLCKELKVKNDFSLSLVWQQYVLEKDNETSFDEKEKNLALKVLQKAISACDKERLREGKALQNEVLNRLNYLQQVAEKVHNLRLEINRTLQDRLKLRIEQLNIPGEVAADRMAQEVVMLIDKMDIAEELTRLTEHITHMKELVQSTVALGKKLDFYTQELLREINTIGSKAAHAGLTELVVDAKGCIEQIREQVQNIE